MRTVLAFSFSLSVSLAATALNAQVAPIPAPPAPAPVVILTDHAFDGRGAFLRSARISVAEGKITSTSAPASTGAAVIDLRGYTVLPGWIDTHVHLDSHFDRTGKIAGRNEPPTEAA
jgi:imidazolonepropionase-like amidohydrolase